MELCWKISLRKFCRQKVLSPEKFASFASVQQQQQHQQQQQQQQARQPQAKGPERSVPEDDDDDDEIEEDESYSNTAATSAVNSRSGSVSVSRIPSMLSAASALDTERRPLRWPPLICPYISTLAPNPTLDLLSTRNN